MTRPYYMDNYMFHILASEWMDHDAPGMQGGASSVRRCARALQTGNISEKHFLFTKEIENNYNIWCSKSGRQAFPFPVEAQRQYDSIINKRRKNVGGVQRSTSPAGRNKRTARSAKSSAQSARSAQK